MSAKSNADADPRLPENISAGSLLLRVVATTISTWLVPGTVEATGSRTPLVLPAQPPRTIEMISNGNSVALHLLDLGWKEHGRQKWAYESGDEIVIPLANSTLAELGVTRWAKCTALRELEALGLISIDWRTRKSPLIRPLKL